MASLLEGKDALGVRYLGAGGFFASEQGLGCMSLTSGFYHAETDEQQSAEVIKTALALGVTLLDTMDLYGPYINEELIGRTLKDVPRESYKIATKWGPMLKDGKFVFDLSPKACRAACEGSLKRLGIEYIDLWILRMHGRDPKTPLEDTVNTMKALVDEGKVKYIGLSEMSPSDIRKVHAITPVSAIEMEWSLFSRDCEEDLVPTCRELGIGFLAYSPLGRGLLTGSLKMDELAETDFRRKGPRFQDENLRKNLELVEKVKALAEKKGCTPGQLALAWVQARGPDVIPIPGTRRVKYLEENVAALKIKLSEEEIKELEDAVPHAQVAGERYDGGNKLTYKYDAE